MAKTKSTGKYGNSEDIKNLQISLIFLGYNLPKFGADGHYGTETENALIKFKNKVSVSQKPSDGRKIDMNNPKVQQTIQLPNTVTSVTPSTQQPLQTQHSQIKPLTLIPINESQLNQIIDQETIDKLIDELKKNGLTEDDIQQIKTKKYSGLSYFPKENINALLSAMDRHGITNEYSRKAILGVISKESPNLSSEKSYATTSADKIREIWPSLFKDKSDTAINTIKKKDKFWDIIYGGKYGNTEPGDGAKYRGRGFNQLTFKNNYIELQKEYEMNGSKLGKINIVNNPDILNTNKDVSAEFAILYFIKAFKQVNKDLNQYTDLQSAVTDFVRANAGWKTPLTNKVVAQGHQKALAFAKSLNTSFT
ncbi:MAG: peptidoglycan-binding protein [Bacilli bacterium]